MTVPVFDAKSEFDKHRAEFIEAAERVLASGRYILGPEVEAFEHEIASYVGVRHAVSCASGTDALCLALRALGIGPGDGVVIPAFTFFATASAVLSCGATPIFCDIDPTTYTIDPRALTKILGGRSPAHSRVGVDPGSIRAVIPVHLFGHMADMDAVVDVARDSGARVVEDAAQAFGAHHGRTAAGACGDVGCFSFFPTKPLGGFGDGGMVTTFDPDVDEKLRLLRAHGSRSKYFHDIVGTNSRLDELQAALLRVRLGHVDDTLASRTALADAYDAALGDRVATPHRPPIGTHTFALYVIAIAHGRDQIAEGLSSRGISTAIHYPLPAHLQPAALGLRYAPGDFPVSENSCREVLTLPLYPTLDAAVVRKIGDLVSRLVGGGA